MSTFKSVERRKSEPELARAHKKPYQKPALRSEQVFETSALSCGKVGATQSGCQSNRSAS